MFFFCIFQVLSRPSSTSTPPFNPSIDSDTRSDGVAGEKGSYFSSLLLQLLPGFTLLTMYNVGQTLSVRYFPALPFVFYPIQVGTDYGRPEGEQPSLHGQKFNPNPKFLGVAAAYFVCHIGPIFQISLIYAFIGCP